MATRRELSEGQWVLFHPSPFYKGATPLDAQVMRVWSAECVNLAVSYPDGVRLETSVLVRLPGEAKPAGAYCVPKDDVS